MTFIRTYTNTQGKNREAYAEYERIDASRVRVNWRAVSDGKLIDSAILTNAEAAAHGAEVSTLAKPPATQPVPTEPQPAGRVYLGAYMEGAGTYNHYFPGQRPNGGTWGNAPWDAETQKRFEASAGKRLSIVSFGLSGAFSAGACQLVRDRGGIPLMGRQTSQDLTGELRRIANGDYDAAWTTWAQAAKAWGFPMFMHFNREMNGQWYGWGKEAAASLAAGENPNVYVKAYRRIAGIVRPIAPNVAFVWCVNTEFPGSTPLAPLYPGDDVVDWAAIDGYSDGYRGFFRRTFAEAMKPTYDKIGTITQKPVMVCETACSEYGGSKPDFIKSIPAGLDVMPRMKAVTWFNWRIDENNRFNEWPIESTADGSAPGTGPTTAAFKSVATQARFFGPEFATLPAGTKPPVPA